MARAETDGYRLARHALRHRVFVAEVLYFSHDKRRDMPFPSALRFRDDDGCVDEASVKPWAVLSYFDRDTPRLETTSDENFEIAPNPDFTFDSMLETPNSIEASSELRPCLHYPMTMTKMRREFGFDEPHPRHGRVPVDECLEYVEMVLRDVVFPCRDTSSSPQILGSIKTSSATIVSKKNWLPSVGSPVLPPVCLHRWDLESYHPN